jgi:hypothetical protein
MVINPAKVISDLQTLSKSIKNKTIDTLKSDGIAAYQYALLGDAADGLVGSAWTALRQRFGIEQQTSKSLYELLKTFLADVQLHISLTQGYFGDDLDDTWDYDKINHDYGILKDAASKTEIFGFQVGDSEAQATEQAANALKAKLDAMNDYEKETSQIYTTEYDTLNKIIHLLAYYDDGSYYSAQDFSWKNSYGQTVNQDDLKQALDGATAYGLDTTK